MASIHSKKVLIAPILLIVLLGCIVYGNSIHGKFVYDDDVLIKDNVYLKNPSYISRIFTGNILEGAGKRCGFYRPIQIFSYAVDYSIWKFNVVGYHLANIFLHILVALSIYWFINILFKDKVLSLLAGIFFVVHPVHTEAVAYISGRAESLYLLFLLLSFIFYIKSLHARSIIPYLLMVLSYTLALLSKENSLILIALLPLYHYTFKEKIRRREFLSLLGIVFIYAVLRTTLLKSVSFAPPQTTLFQRLPGFFVAITNYIRLLLVPFNLHMEYGAILFNFTNPQAIAGVIILLSLLFYGLRIITTNKLIFFSLFWFLFALFPVSNFYPLNAYMAEHWLYLPSIGFFIILAKCLSSLYKKEGFKIFTLVFMISLIIFHSSVTIKQNNYWKEPIAFYERTLKYAPYSSRVYYNLGIAYYDIGKKQEAIAMYKKAIELNPNYADGYNNLGIAYYDIGKKQEAIAMYKKAIELNPDYAEAYNNLGNIYGYAGNKEGSIAMYKKAIELNPDYADAYYNLGVVYYDIGNKEGSIAMYKKAIELNPDYAETYYNRGKAYFDKDNLDQAISDFNKAIEINPNYADAYKNRAVAYFLKYEYEKAREDARKAESLGTTMNPEFLEDLKKYHEK